MDRALEEFKHTVTLLPGDAHEVMRTAKCCKRRGRMMIRYNCKWLRLCRTDLMNDVTTVDGDEASKKPSEWRDFYISKIRYGVRVTDRTFAVIDSVSDG